MTTTVLSRDLDPSSGILRVSEVAYQPGEIQARHAHETASLTLLLSGDVEEKVGRQLERSQALSIVAKPAGVEHENWIGSTGLCVLQVELDPRADLLASHPDGPMAEWRWYHPSLASGPFLALLDAVRRDATGQSLGMAVTDVLGSLGPQSRSRREPHPPLWLRQVRDELDATFARPTPVEALATCAGVHPVYLARAFRRHFGMSITEHVRMRRISEASARLRRREPTIASVAQATGFSDQAHLARVFKKATGLTPSAFRAHFRDEV